MGPPRKAKLKPEVLQRPELPAELRRRGAGLPRHPPEATAVVEAAAIPSEGHETVRGRGIDAVAHLTVLAEGEGRPEGAPQVQGHHLVAGFAAAAAAEVAGHTVPGGVLGGDPGRHG